MITKKICCLLSIKELNGISLELAITPDRYHTQYRNREIFCQIPDNNTPLTQGSVTSNNIISLLIGARVFETVQYYNPPINKLNQIEVGWFDVQANQISLDSSGYGAINEYYFTIRIHYFQKRYNTTAFSTSVYNNVGSGTMDSIFSPG